MTLDSSNFSSGQTPPPQSKIPSSIWGFSLPESENLAHRIQAYERWSKLGSRIEANDKVSVSAAIGRPSPLLDDHRFHVPPAASYAWFSPPPRWTHQFRGLFLFDMITSFGNVVAMQGAFANLMAAVTEGAAEKRQKAALINFFNLYGMLNSEQHYIWTRLYLYMSG